MRDLDSARITVSGHADQLRQPSLDDGVPGPRERCWRLFLWIATMAMIGTALSLISTP